MFEDQDKDAIFLETCMKARSQRHMVIECVPVPKEIGDMAPIYFKVNKSQLTFELIGSGPDFFKS